MVDLLHEKMCLRSLFHPLRNFPGPKRAAIGSLYEFCYDVVKDGTYIWQIEKMHRQYGPIVRINSRSLHIHDPEYFSAGGGRTVNKESSAVAGYTFPHSTIATIEHDLHRKRRAVVNPYFSKRSIVNLKPIINERLNVLCSRLQKANAQDEPADLTSAFSAFTADVIMYHFYGSHQDYLGSEAFQFGLKDTLTALLHFYHITRFLPFPPTMIKSLPLSILRLINSDFLLVEAARNDNKKRIAKVLESKRETKAISHSVVISALTDPSIPAHSRE